LLEIMVGVTIFSIISLAILTTFRTGLKSYESGREQMALTQTARSVFELMSRDLRALYYLRPVDYNQDMVHRLGFLQAQRWQMQQMAGESDRRVGRFRDRRSGARPDEVTRKDTVGVPVDFTIIGVDSEKGDSLTFVCTQPNWGTTPIQPWALARVKYTIKDGNLFRTEGPVTVDELPSFQFQPLEMPNPTPETETKPESEEPATPESADHYLKDAPHELVARNVKTFDLRYGYWTPEGWFEAPDWMAHERRYRNLGEKVDPTDPNAAMLRQRELMRPTDDVPAYINLTVALAYSKDNVRTRVFRSRIRLLRSQEVYEPPMDFGGLLGGPGGMQATRFGYPASMPWLGPRR
jgi:type II secretory pathway pseudopilin PulG